VKRSAAASVSGLALALASALAPAACSSPRGRDVDASPVGSAPAPDGRPDAPAAVPLPDDLEPAAAAERPDGGTVTIKLLADAHRQAHVFWGRKDLGVAPLQIVRPRGSAPLDLTILAAGCLPFHTRVFADRDDTLSVRLYTERDAIALPGYSPPADAAPSSPTKTRR
jgi:hypothetical protein